MKGSLLFLGTGGSAGIPLIGCHCKVCKSTSSYNQRLRPSVLLTLDDKVILVDAGPDLRAQALKYQIDRLDGVLLTHAHFDHIGGLDDLRAYFLLQNRPLPCLLSQATYVELFRRYSYLFMPHEPGRSLPAQFDFQIVTQKFGSAHFAGIDWNLLSFVQMKMEVTGFRLGNLAFLSDLKDYDDHLVKAVEGVDFVVMSAISEEASLAHLSVAEAIDLAAQMKAKRVWLTHVSHKVDHEELSRKLPKHVSLAYDGLVLEFSTS